MDFRWPRALFSNRRFLLRDKSAPVAWNHTQQICPTRFSGFVQFWLAVAGPNPSLSSRFLLLARQGFGLPPPVGLSGLVFVSIFATRSFLPLALESDSHFFCFGSARASSRSSADHRFPVHEQPCCRVRSSSISSASAIPVCFSRPSLMAHDLPPWRGHAQVRPHVRAACPSSSFLRPCQVFASTSRIRVGVALCLICSPVDRFSLTAVCVVKGLAFVWVPDFHH
jgi:hypothetical protein